MRYTSWMAAALIWGIVGWAAGSAQEPAAGEAGKITYDEHVRPILREHCFTCHNQNSAKSGLALDSYARAREGGSSGEVLVAQDLESSRLWALVSHAEEPAMPPGQDKLPDAKLELIRQWIAGGLLENAGSSSGPNSPTVTWGTVGAVLDAMMKLFT